MYGLYAVDIFDIHHLFLGHWLNWMRLVSDTGGGKRSWVEVKKYYILHSYPANHSFETLLEFKAQKTNLVTGVIPCCPIHQKLGLTKYREWIRRKTTKQLTKQYLLLETDKCSIISWANQQLHFLVVTLLPLCHFIKTIKFSDALLNPIWNKMHICSKFDRIQHYCLSHVWLYFMPFK